jgi:hypothetical protein
VWDRAQPVCRPMKLDRSITDLAKAIPRLSV